MVGARPPRQRHPAAPRGRQAGPTRPGHPRALHFSGGWKGSATGYDLSGDPTAEAWFSSLTPAQLAQVEFDHPAGNGAWTDSRCGVAALSADTLSYTPPSGRPITGLDVELPRLERLVQGAGSLTRPVHDITFAGLQFSYATWNAPSLPTGFADVQSNLRRTGATDQGLCTFSDPAGSCPWGAFTQPLANVAFSGASRVTLADNRFVDLGGAGLSFMYGGTHNVVEGNEFTAIASTALSLGCTFDPTPTQTPAQIIKANCTPDPGLVTVGPYLPRPQITAPTDGTTGLATTFTVHGAAQAGNDVTVNDPTDQATCTATTTADGTWSCTLRETGPGQHTLTALQTDRDGTVSKTSPALPVYVGTPPATVRGNDTDPSIRYAGWDYLDNRGLGDLDDDIHYTTTDGNTFTLTKLSGTYATFDGLQIDNTPPQ